jgi:hypothetical protein
MSQVKKKFLANGAIANLLNNVAIKSRNAADSADLDVLKLNASNQVEVAQDMILASGKNIGNQTNLVNKVYLSYIYDGSDKKAFQIGSSDRQIFDASEVLAADFALRTLNYTAGTAIDFSGSTVDINGLKLVTNNMDANSLSIVNLADPSALSDAATKNYVDTQISGIDLSGYVLKAGDTMSGNLAMGGNKVTGLAAASANGEALRYNELGANSGIATLDAGGKVPVSQLPSSLMTYEGTWNASTNTPTLADGVGDAGMVYIVSVAGTQNLGSGSITFGVGDWVIYNGTIWEKSSNSNAVVSVNSQTGVVVLDSDDIAEGAVNLYQKAWGKESITLVAGDITNQYVDLAETIIANSLDLVVSGVMQAEGTDYTVSLTGGAGGVTRVTFAGDLATGGAAELVAGDILRLKYQY